MNKSWALAALLIMLPFGAGIGVTQDYMPDNYVQLPLGGTTCHRVWLATEANIEYGQVKLELSGELPSFIIADMNDNGIYDTYKGSSEAIIFHIASPGDAKVGDIYHVGFAVSGIDKPSPGMVPISGAIGSGFDIKIVNATAKNPDRCSQLPSTRGETPLPPVTVANIEIPEIPNTPPIATAGVSAEIVAPFNWVLACLVAGCVIIGSAGGYYIMNKRKKQKAETIYEPTTAV